MQSVGGKHWQHTFFRLSISNQNSRPGKFYRTKSNIICSNDTKRSRSRVESFRKFFGIRDLPSSKLGIPVFFKSKIRATFGIESIHGMWDIKNNHRDYGISRNFGSGSRDWRTLLGTLKSHDGIWDPLLQVLKLYYSKARENELSCPKLKW